MGLGIEFDPYQFQPSPDRWQTILDRVRYAQPGFFRVMSGASDYCLGFDSAGSPIYVWEHSDAVAQQQLDKLLQILDFAQANNIDILLGEWSPPRALGITRPDDPRWSRIIADFVEFLVRQKHYTVIRHYIIFNEPNGKWMWPHASPDFAAWSAGIKNLRRELDLRGLQAISLSGPDNSGDAAWFAQSVRELSMQFGAWESHIYASDAEVYDGTIRADLEKAKSTILMDPNGASKKRFIAESGLRDGKNELLDQQPRVLTFPYGVIMADYVAQIAQAGWMGADAWDLDDAMHGNGHGGLKMWGFWDSSAASDMSIRPWFYTWALMSRLFPRGAQILQVDTEPDVPRFRAIASVWDSGAGKQFATMLVNDSDTDRTITVRISSSAPHTLYQYNYFDHDRPIDERGLPKPSNIIAGTNLDQGLSIRMPSRGVIFLTSMKPRQIRM